MTEAGVAPPGWGAAPGAPWGGGLGLGAGVMRGQALERGGNAAFSDSSAFLRSSRETLAPSLRARSPAQRGRFPCGDVVGSGGDPRALGVWGPAAPSPPPPPPGRAVPAPSPCGAAGWEGQGPPRPAVGGRAGGWVGRVCIGAAWFCRGGVAAAWGRVLGAPELRSCSFQPPCCLGYWGGGGAVGLAGPPPPPPPPRGGRGCCGCCGKRPALGSAWVWGSLVSPSAGEGSGRAPRQV